MNKHQQIEIQIEFLCNNKLRKTVHKITVLGIRADEIRVQIGWLARHNRANHHKVLEMPPESKILGYSILFVLAVRLDMMFLKVSHA